VKVGADETDTTIVLPNGKAWREYASTSNVAI
jgi:hypothetical protein